MTRRSDFRKASCCGSSLSAVRTCSQLISALILCILLLRGVDAQSQCDEVRALLDFKHRLLTSEDYFFDGSGYWSTWNETDENPCAWEGVLCSPSLTVESLDFSGWGEGPTDLNLEPFARLPDLRRLDLSSSFFYEIPPSIENLTGLVSLDMSQNNIQDSISANLSKCMNLQYICLEGNLLHGAIPSLRELKNLEILNLANNLLTGPFPEDLPELTSLVSVDLTGNRLNGSIPSLPHLTNLLDLKLGNNNFTQFEDYWLPPPRLKALDVSGNLLEGMVPASITNLSTLLHLNISRNQFSRVPLPISQLFPDSISFSFSFDLSQNQFTGNILSSLFPEQELGFSPTIFLNLSGNNITSSLPFDQNQIYPTHYDVLDLSHNQLSGPISNILPTGIAYDFHYLLLQNNHLSGDIVDFLFNYNSTSKVMELQVQNNQFTGDLSRVTSPDFAGAFDKLEILDISNNNLHMHSTPANPSSPASSLSILLESLMQSTELSVLRLGGNSFSGIAAPAYFTNVSSNLQILDLRKLKLEGELLDSAFNRTCFPALQFLDLSFNQLTGPVPNSIVDLPNLAVLNLAYNKLSGPLPNISSGSPLYNPNFFGGNDKLCGDPVLPCSQGSRIRIQWWLLLIIVGSSSTIVVGTCLVATWRWSVYSKRHQQDADLIKTLMDKESATLMSFRELKKATNNFECSSKIGEGGFGIVYKGKLSDGSSVAIKRRKREGSEKDKKDFLNEVRILSQVNHRHLVKLLGCCMENQVAILVFEFISNGTLQEHLQHKIGGGCLSWKQRLNIAIETADALNYLHLGATIPIYHRDVKSANILLDDDLHAKVTDFGISKLASIEATHVSTVAIQGTFGYIDPEYYTSYQFTDKSDVYSFGVVLLELISAKYPVDFRRGGEEISLVLFSKPYIQSGCLEELIDPTLMETYEDPSGKESIFSVGCLAMKCLDMRSKERPSMNQVWKELQNLGCDFDSSWTCDDPREDPKHDHIASSSQSFSSNSSRSILTESSVSGIEMSHLDSL